MCLSVSLPLMYTAPACSTVQMPAQVTNREKWIFPIWIQDGIDSLEGVSPFEAVRCRSEAKPVASADMRDGWGAGVLAKLKGRRKKLLKTYVLKFYLKRDMLIAKLIVHNTYNA